MRLRPSLIRRAIRNLIENAIKYGGEAQVTLAGDTHRATIIVTDNGPGIPEEQMANVFEAFTRIETSRNKGTGGIGLGLALAAAIVREAGGDITLTNRDTGGLEARIVLPRDKRRRAKRRSILRQLCRAGQGEDTQSEQRLCLCCTA